MDAGAVNDPVLELCLRHAREEREEITLWLAVQVLMSDSVATADEALQDRLCVLQDRIENMMRSRFDLADRDFRARAREETPTGEETQPGEETLGGEPVAES